MKDKPRYLTILSGITTILLGIAILVISIFILLSALAVTDPLVMLATLGLLFVLQLIFFIIALAISIVVIIIGSLQIKLGTVSYYEYSLRKGSVIGYCCFDIIFSIIAGVASFFVFESKPMFAICLALLIVFLICFTIKIIDFSLFKRKVNKGLISIEKPKFNINLESLNLKNENLKEVDKNSK